MNDDVIEIKDSGFKKLLKAFKENIPTARVGVLGDDGARSAENGIEGVTNAEVGAAHEFGTEHLPMRSFLRVPIAEHLEQYMQKNGAFKKDVINRVIEEGSLVPYMKNVGITGEQIVADAFASGGFGKWPQWKTPGYQNNTGQILVDTKQLRDSITSDVK